MTEFVSGPEIIVNAHSQVVAAGSVNGSTFYGLVGSVKALVKTAATASTILVAPCDGGDTVSIKITPTLLGRFRKLIEDGLASGRLICFTNLQVTGSRSFMARDACALMGPWDEKFRE